MTLSQETIDAIVDAVWQKAIEAGYDADRTVRIIAASMAGKVSGSGTGTVTFRDLLDSTDMMISDVTNKGERITVQHAL